MNKMHLVHFFIIKTNFIAYMLTFSKNVTKNEEGFY